MPTRRPFVLLLLCVTGTFAAAQGPAYREHWGYTHLEHRRLELLRALAGRESASDEVARLCAAPDRGVPFRPIAQALASLRGVEADPAFELRTAVGLYVLPEVADPDGRNEVCRAVNLTVFLPFFLESPGQLAFDLEVTDAGGEVVFERRLTADTDIEGLRMARPKATVPCGELADGAYRVALATIVDGAPPRPHDPTLEWTFHVLRGYQERAAAALGGALAARDGLDQLPRALLDGIAGEVARAYGGEAFVVRSDAVRDLERLETALANVAAERPVLAGMTGPVATALPGGDLGALPCVLRSVPEGDDARPLVVFATATPAYDAGAHRPTAPAARMPAWLSPELDGFAAERPWRVAGLASPGGGRPYVDSLRASLTALGELLPTGGRKPVLVCDREAAGIVGLGIAKIAPLVSGLVFVGGGAMPEAALEVLDGVPVRLVRLAGHPATAAVDRLLAWLADHAEPGRYDVRLLHERALPWPYGVPLSLPEIEAFAATRFAR